MNRSLIRVRRKRFLAFFMALVLVLGMMPAGAMGSDPETGESTEDFYVSTDSGASWELLSTDKELKVGDQIRRGRNALFSVQINTFASSSSDMPFTDGDGCGEWVSERPVYKIVTGTWKIESIDVSGDDAYISLNGKYKINYNLNGGAWCQGVAYPESYVYGKETNLPGKEALTKSEHIFLGWYDSELAEGSGPIEKIGPEEAGDKTFIANWYEKTATTLTVSIDGDGWTYGDLPKQPVVTIRPEYLLDKVTFTYSPADADNYSSNAPTAAGTYMVKASVPEDKETKSAEATAKFAIAPKTVRVLSGITAADKQYDGNKTAVLDCSKAVFDGKVEGDSLNVTAEGVFSDINVGTNKSVSITGLVLGGISAGNYTLASEGQQTSATASITAKPVTVSGITAENKQYDGNTTASLKTDSAVLSGKLDADKLSVTATGTFEDANVGADKTVKISGLTLGGESAGNPCAFVGGRF